MTLPRLSRTSYSGTNVLRSTPMPLLGRSRTCPIDAFTTKPSPRYLLIVLALAGDSTITRDLPLRCFAISNSVGHVRAAYRENPLSEAAIGPAPRRLDVHRPA